jgi:hypothetical protein
MKAEYRSGCLNEMELFNMFVHAGVSTSEIAAMDSGMLTQQIAEMRSAEPDDLPYTDAEIADAILRYASENENYN